jgi:hypothetical protein
LDEVVAGWKSSLTIRARNGLPWNSRGPSTGSGGRGGRAARFMDLLVTNCREI